MFRLIAALAGVFYFAVAFGKFAREGMGDDRPERDARAKRENKNRAESHIERNGE